MASAFPYRNEFALAHSRLIAAAHCTRKRRLT
jgi:hypothetical protein